MKLYFSPLACSLSSRIALYETGASADFVEVDPKTKTTSDGRSYLPIHPLGLVPLLELDDGSLLSENSAILQFLSEGTSLAPTSPIERMRLQQWLGFIASDLHQVVYGPHMDKKAPPEAKAHALAKTDARLQWIAKHVADREYLLGRFTVADAYLFVILNWTVVTPISLEPYPAIRTYHARVGARPHVQRAFNEERALYAKSR